MDPLSPSNINPSWSNSPPSNTTRPLDSSQLPNSASSSSFREPKVFGAPGLGLVSPPPPSHEGIEAQKANTNGAAGQVQREKNVPYLRVRIGGLERNRKDLLIRFDASTNLPNFRTGMYRNMQRSYVEFQRFAEQAQLTSPQTIIPALPLASTSAVTDEEDDRLVRIALQRWFTRICEDPVLLKDDELRSFIESDFGYSPVPPPSSRRPASATSAVPNVFSAAISKVVRRGALDEDDELQTAKGALESLETRWGGAAASIGALGKARRAHALANQDVGAKMISLSTVEPDMQLAAAERKIGRSLEQLSGMAGAQAASENVVLSDSLGYQALNARAAKDTLVQRTQILEDAHNATKNAITKRRNVERLKGSSSINPMKVDDAISEMHDAEKVESRLTNHLQAISQNLHQALKSHSRAAHEDVALALLENARLTVGFHKHALRELEALRSDIARIGTASSSVAATTTTATTPSYAPPPPVSNPYTTAYAPPPTTGPPPSILPARPYHASPPRAPPMETSKSMFLPPQTQPNIPRPNSAEPTRPADPLAGQTPGMAQSMMLPGQSQAQRAQTMGRAQARRLDERQAAKLLAGGF
ncbi:hypothetical protein BCR39DRAFT_549535 [Naematelia encephala]|uniref:PX domain-containing protein n=1 Tax=Naematelia encephala TaxID=71784 RepID=A0A1Y2ALU1_9TREE|nr:hypothetical protein BCR39DRAFT_549535 [Naematelia encephala]